MKSWLGFAVLAFFLAGAAQARTYCCRDDKGVQICADILPAVCYGRAYREVNDRGMTVKRYDAPLTAEQRAQKEAEAKKAQEAELKRIEQERRNRALLATYASEQDIDYMRDSAVADLEKTLQQHREKYDEAAKKQKKLAGETEFYKKKGLPPEMQAAMRDNESEMKAQLAAIEAKQKEIVAVKAKYEEEKLRYRELTSGARKPNSN